MQDPRQAVSLLRVPNLGFDIRELLILKKMKAIKKFSKSREEEEGRDKEDKNWKVEEMRRRKGCDN